MDTRNFRDILTQMQKTLECSICLELLSNPVSTKCDHQFCSFCITKFLQSKRSVPCPLCKKPVTKRGIQERSELSLVINNVKQLIAAYEADTKEKFTPSKTYREVLPATHNRKANRKQASDRRVKNITQTPDCPNVDICHGDSESTSVSVGGSQGLHSLVTGSAPRTRSRRRSQIVSSAADTVVSGPDEQSSRRCQIVGSESDTVVSRPGEQSSKRQSNGNSPDINGHRRPGRKRKLSFQSMTSDNGNTSIVGQTEKFNDNFAQHDVLKRTQGDEEHHVSNADILCYLEEGSCGAVQGVLAATRNENYEHVISAGGREVNGKQEPADSNQKCENIPQSVNRRTPCKNKNNKISALRSSKAKLLPCVTDSSNSVPDFPILSTGSSQNIVADKTEHNNEPKRNEALERDSELDPLPFPSNSEIVTDVCRAVSPSSEASSGSSTQQLLKPKPITARTYSRDMRKSFHDGFVKNWAATLPEKNTGASNWINQPKGLTTKEKIYTKKQKSHQPTRLQVKVTNESNIFKNAETVITDSDSLHHPATPQAMFEPPLAQVQNRKSIFKSRIQNAGNKNGVLNTTLSGEMTNEDPFEFKVGHTPVKPKRKIGAQQNGLKIGKSKEGVPGCKAQNKNKKISMRKCEVAVVQSIPLEHVSVSKQETARDSTALSLSSTEVEEIKAPSIFAGVSKAIEKDETSHVQKKTVHFHHDLVDVDTDVQPNQGNMSVPKAMIPAEVNATVALDSQTHQQCMQDEAVGAQQQMGQVLQPAAVSLAHNILDATAVQVLQPAEDTLHPDKNVAMNYNKADLVNENTQFQDITVTLKEAAHTFRNQQTNNSLQSPGGDASCLLPGSRKVGASAQKRKFARRRKKPTCPDTETFSQKAGKELTKLIHKINEAEDYELMFSTQDAHKRLQEDLQKEQMLEEAFGFATQDSGDFRFSESKDETANNVTETGHAVRPAMVDQADHIEQIYTQENSVSPNANHNTNSVMNMLEKTNTLEKSKGLGASNIESTPFLINIDIDNARVVPHIDIDKPGAVAHIDISTDGNDADYRGERMNSTLLEPVELGSSHINQMLQLKSRVSLHTKQHTATTPVEAKRARIFPRPNFNDMVLVSPCAKGVLTPTKPPLMSSSSTELHSSHMDAVSARTRTANISICQQSLVKQDGNYCDQNVNSKIQSSARTSTPNISICEQSPVKQDGRYCDQNVNSKIQSSLTSNITARNQVKEGHESPAFKAMHMHSHIPISDDNIPNLGSIVSSNCANKDLDVKFSLGTKTRIVKTLNTPQLSLKSKNTSEAAFGPPDKNNERAAHDAVGCDVILAPDTCIYSSSCRISRDGSKNVEEEADVILETLDLYTNLQHTNDIHSDHIILGQHSPLKSHGFDQRSTPTTVTTTNRTSEEAVAESQILTTCSTQGPVMFPQDSIPTNILRDEPSSSCWIDPKKTKMAYPDTAALINLSSEEEKKNVTQSAVIVVTSQETSSGCSSHSQSILRPTGANDLQEVHRNDISHSGNNCARFQKPSLDKSPSACDDPSRSLCLAVPETPNSRSSPNNKISSAPGRITCSESEDEDYMLIVRRRKRKCFSLDGSPLKPVVFGCEPKLLEDELAPGTKNDKCDVDMIGETEAMRAIDTWTQRDVEDTSGAQMSHSCVSESLKCQQEEAMYLNVLIETEEDRSSPGQTMNKMSPELLELPTGELRGIDSSRKIVSSLNDINSALLSKPKSQKRLFSQTSEARLTKQKTNRQHENNFSDHRNGNAVIKLNNNVNGDNDQNKLSENMEIYVPETNVMSDDDDDDSHNRGNNGEKNLLIDTGLDISLSDNAAETSATDTGTVCCELKEGKQTKRGLAKKGSLNLDTSAKHPRSLLSPASKAVVRSGVEKPTDQRVVPESDSDVILIDAEEEDTVGVTEQNSTLAEAIPGSSKKYDSDVEIADSGNISRRRQKVKKLPVETKLRKCKVKTTENKYYDAKKQLEKELFGVDSKKKLNSQEEKDRNEEMPADQTKHACTKDVEKAAHTCAGSVHDQGDDDLLFDLGDSSDDEILYGGHVRINARPVKNQNHKSAVIDQLDDSVCMSGSPPVTSSPLEVGNCLEHETIDQSVITAVYETDVDDEDSMGMRPKSRVKRLQIVSDSEDSNQEAIPVRSSTNCTSSSVLSSQSEILNTEQQEALEEDVAKLHQQIAEYEAKLGQESADLRLTAAAQEERAGTKASADAAHTSDEDSDDLFVSPLSPSPPRQPRIKSVPKRPAHSKPNRQTDLYIKQFQSPGGTVRTKKSLEFTINTSSSHSEANNIAKANCLLETKPLDLIKESNITNVLQKQSSDRVLHDITHTNIVSPDAVNRDEVIDMNEPLEDKLVLSPVILSQKSRQIMSESDKREMTSSMTGRCLKYPPEKDVCLVASALGREEYLLVQKLAERYGLKLTSKFSTEVTHVVMKPGACPGAGSVIMTLHSSLSVETTGYDRVCDRTLKFFQGVAYKCWVVAFPWVLDSLQTGSLLPEEDYEIIGDTSGGESTFGVRQARLSREHLFTDFCLACVGDSSEMPKASLRELVTVCGASVVDDPIGLLSKVARYKIIVRCSDSNIAPSTAELDMFNGLYKHMGLLTVMREWVLDSLGSYRLQPLIEYVINTGATNVPF